MPYNLLLLPLLGGFVFARYWNVSRYHVLRAEKERLLIIAAIAGLVWLIIAFFLATAAAKLFPCKPNYPCISEWWGRHVPFEFSGVSLLAFFLGAVSWIPLNWEWMWKKLRVTWLLRQAAIDRVIEEDGAPFELLLKQAQDDGKTVAVTLKSGKVYVGFVIHTINPALPTRYIRLLPTKSGYRDEKNKWFQFTTFYSKALNKVDIDYDAKLDQLDDAELQLKKAEREYVKKKSREIEDRIKHLQNTVIPALDDELEQLSSVADDLNIVIAVPEIVSINVYSEYIHAQYFPPATDPPTTAS